MNYLESPYLRSIFDLGLLHLELNTLLFVLGLVLVSMLALNTLLFRPVLRTLENRAALKNSLEDDMSSGRSEVARLRETYDKDLTKLREEVAQLRAASNKESQQAVAAILDAARKEGQQEYQRAGEMLVQQVADARKNLSGVAKKLADSAIDRLLGA